MSTRPASSRASETPASSAGERLLPRHRGAVRGVRGARPDAHRPNARVVELLAHPRVDDHELGVDEPRENGDRRPARGEDLQHLPCDLRPGRRSRPRRRSRGRRPRRRSRTADRHADPCELHRELLESAEASARLRLSIELRACGVHRVERPAPRCGGQARGRQPGCSGIAQPGDDERRVVGSRTNAAFTAPSRSRYSRATRRRGHDPEPDLVRDDDRRPAPLGGELRDRLGLRTHVVAAREQVRDPEGQAVDDDARLGLDRGERRAERDRLLDRPPRRPGARLRCCAILAAISSSRASAVAT